MGPCQNFVQWILWNSKGIFCNLGGQLETPGLVRMEAIIIPMSLVIKG